MGSQIRVQVDDGPVLRARHRDSTIRDFGDAPNRAEFPRPVAKASEPGFQRSVLAVGSHPREQSVRDDETAVPPLEELAHLGDGIGRALTQYDDLRQLEDVLEGR